MTDSERWRLALQAHAVEHQAMRDRGLSRVVLYGRPRQLGRTFLRSRQAGGGSVIMAGLSGLGLGQLGISQRDVTVAAVVAAGLVGFWWLSKPANRRKLKRAFR